MSVDLLTPGNLHQQAGRLLAFGLHARTLPAMDDEYRDLVARYRTDSRFQQMVDRFAAGLGLQVTHASQLGFYLAAADDSPFAYTLAHFRRERGLSDVSGPLVRGLYGLIVVGIAAYFYPRPQHLADERHPLATAAQIDAFVRTACEELRSRMGHEDPTLEAADREPAWRFYLRQKETSRGADGRRGQQGTLPAIEKVLEAFVEQGLVRRVREGREGAATQYQYQPLERFRQQVVSLAGEELFEALSSLRLPTGRSPREGR